MEKNNIDMGHILWKKNIMQGVNWFFFPIMLKMRL